ncbi:unnamed protein product, partial [Hymenolepis diminuta]
EHIRHILLFEFHQGNTASLVAKTLQDTHGNNVVNEKICRRCFSAGGFKKDDFSLKDERRIEIRMLKKLNSVTCCVLLRFLELHAPFLD